jgi:gamma-glutamylcyclotransferase (GGCT)/AIG2-like uncharacterized protein YtfP
VSGGVALFVYGTLAPGRRAWELLAPHTTARRRAVARGRLYDTGRGYPAAVFDSAGPPLPGWCCELTDPPLAELDRWEGPEYARVQVTLDDGTTAFAYHWIAPLEGLEPCPSGVWDPSAARPPCPRAGTGTPEPETREPERPEPESERRTRRSDRG